MSTELKNRFDFVYLFDIQDGNPNGDPDAGNMPRIDPETRQGIVTDVCLKRKVRNYVLVSKDIDNQLENGYDIFIREKAVLDKIVNHVWDDSEVKNAKKVDEQKKAAKKLLCSQFYDIRAFGAVIATSGKTDQVRGPIQLTFSRSIDPIEPVPHSITRMAVTKEDEKKERTMGRKSTVPYGLYVCHGFVSANLAHQTGFSEEDLQLFFDALKNMFDVDRSAARGLMSARRLIVFTHDSLLGAAPANQLFDLVHVQKRDETKVPRSFSDYEVTIDTEKLPKGVELIEEI